MSETKLFRIAGSAPVIDMRTGHNATLRPGLVVLSEDAHTHAIAALEAECERLREVNRIQLEMAEVHGAACAKIRRERDALHAEAEALRAENEHLRSGIAGDYDLDAWLNWAEEAKQLRAELEAARGLLREAAEDVESWGAYASAYFQEKHDLAGCAMKYRIAGTVDQGDGGAEQAAIAAMPLTATPAPEVRSQHAERQEAVGYGTWNTGTNPGTRLMRYDGMVAVSPTKTDFYTVPVYTSPPPAHDVSGLVEALRTVVGLLQHKAATPLELEAIRMAGAALAAHRKANQ